MAGVSGPKLNRRLATSKPVRPGIWISRKMRSRLVLLDRGERLEAVARLPDDLDLADSLELITQLVARELLIVDDEDFQTRFGGSGSWALGVGRVMR